MSFLNTSTTVHISTTLPPHITKSQVLSYLHDGPFMLDLNPIIKSHTVLPTSSVTNFLSHVSAANKPPSTGTLPVAVYKIIEATSQTSPGADGSGGSWRGGWAKRFIPDEITYETSVQGTEDGMVSITHAPMGVNSLTKWRVRDTGKEGEGLVLDKEGSVTSNRMLMGFIRTTIQGSYEKLARDFVAELVKRVDAENAETETEVAVGEKIDGDREELTSGNPEVVA